MRELGKFVANDIKDPNGPRLWILGDSRSSAEQQADYRRWRSQFIEGPPQAVPGGFTVEELRAMGMIGLYWPPDAA